MDVSVLISKRHAGAEIDAASVPAQPNTGAHAVRYAQVFAATLLAFFALDVAWLILVGDLFFKRQLGALLRAQPEMIAAAAFYSIYAIGCTTLVVAPALGSRSAMAAATRGAVLGLTAYATFDLTNLAILDGWTLAVTLVDMAWGIVATTIACLAGYWTGRRLVMNIPLQP